MENKYDLIVLNYANGDMVGHTGVFEAAEKAVKTVDECVGKVVAATDEMGGISLITADHGNAELMLNDDDTVCTGLVCGCGKLNACCHFNILYEIVYRCKTVL